MSYLDESSEEPKFIHQGYNQEFIDKMINLIKEGHNVYIVTSRVYDLEKDFPQERITWHLKTLGIINYFPPEHIIYTNRALKAPTLLNLNIDLHHDDDIEEILACREAGVPCIRALEIHPDTAIVTKGVICNEEGKVLLLKRTDNDKRWDLPGGHVKDVEVERGYQGLEDGFEREVAEETGIIVPNQQEFYRFDNRHKGKYSEIIAFYTHFSSETPEIDLGIQEIQENSEFVWVKKEDLPKYLSHATEVAIEAIEFWLKLDHEILDEGAYLASQTKYWKRRKKRLLDMGPNKNLSLIHI